MLLVQRWSAAAAAYQTEEFIVPTKKVEHVGRLCVFIQTDLRRRHRIRGERCHRDKAPWEDIDPRRKVDWKVEGCGGVHTVVA
jgi:hypothetical protein